MANPSSSHDSWFNRIERIGNRIPHPMALFLYLCGIVAVLSVLGEWFLWQATHPVNQEVVQVKSLITDEGIRFVLTTMVKNFLNFAPVGSVVVIVLAFAVAEKSGLLPALIQGIANRASSFWLAPVVALLGVLSSIAMDSGYVVLLPLCMAMFMAYGRHPLAGLALGFAAVSGGFSANLLVGPVDVILSGLSTEAVQLVDANREVSVVANYYFMLASVVLIVLVCLSVNRYLIEPHLSQTKFEAPLQETTTAHFGWSFWLTLVVIVAAWLLLTLPSDAALRDPQTGELIKSPFMLSLVTMIALSVAILSTVYGVSQKRFKGWNDWVQALEHGVKDLAPYLVLMFVVAQFVAWFKWTDMGTVLAIHMAAMLNALSLPAPLALMGLLIFTALLNLVVGSSSAKWAFLAPILVPAFYLAGIEPEAVQGAYRIADSSTNIITPLMPYFPLVLAFAQKYEPEAGVGRVLTLMLPYSLALLVCWFVLFVVWVMAGWPLGPV